MGHLQEMSDKQRSDFILRAYELRKESRRGNSFPYWNEKLHKELTEKGYDIWNGFHEFESGATCSIITAQDKVNELRELGHYARIICGYSQNQQKIRMFTIFYKSKKHNAKRSRIHSKV